MSNVSFNKMFDNGTDVAIATSADEALQFVSGVYGLTPEQYVVEDATEFKALDPNKLFTFLLNDEGLILEDGCTGGVETTLTVGEWCTKLGPGFVMGRE